MQTLALKSACEQCSKAKTKCSGGVPCTTCDKKDIQCFYAIKKKRGPKPGQTKPLRTPKRAKPNFMSTYEKRVWTTFFTMFKNLRKSAKENKYSWQWFVVQLCRLDVYVRKAKSVKGRRLKEVLNNFYKSIDLDPKSFCNSNSAKGCPIPPHLCATCASKALVPDRRSHAHSSKEAVLGITQLPGNISVMRGQRALWEQWKSSSFDVDYENNSSACLVYECTDESFGVFVNEKFVESFGYDSEALTKLLMWSGGGFLPWGGDILAALMVNDADLLLYLKVMATKFQTLASTNHELKHWQDANLGDKEHEETVLPFLEECQWWCKVSADDDSALQPKTVKFTSTVRIKKRRDDSHKVFLRYELKSLTQVKPDKSPFPEATSLNMLTEEPLVPYEDLQGNIASEMNRDLWPLKEEEAAPEFNFDNLDFLMPVAKELENEWQHMKGNGPSDDLTSVNDEQWLQDLVTWAEK